MIGIMVITILILPTFLSKASNDQTTSSNQNSNTGVVTDREEVIYANMEATGLAKEIYVVSILDVVKAGSITDYGTYTSVKNLTNTEVISQKEDEVSMMVPSGKFYYQGTMKKNKLPWDISIEYYLDGNKIGPAELAGRNGKLEIKIETNRNSEMDATFYDNYLLQISITLDSELSKNIAAHGGTTANAGKNKLITYMIMPGKPGNILLTADVTDFIMPGIEITGIPLSMQIDTPDIDSMTDNMMTLSEAINALQDGIEKLLNGTIDLKNGAQELKNGTALFGTGLNQLNRNSNELVSGSKEIEEALNAISASLNQSTASVDTANLAQLPVGLMQLASSLEEISKGLTQLKGGFAAGYLNLDMAIISIPDETISQEDLKALYATNIENKELIDQLVAYYTAAKKVKGTYQVVKPAFAAVEPTIDTMIDSISMITGSIKNIAEQVKTSVGNNDMADKITQLSQGLLTLSENYNGFHNGLVKYTEGVSQLAVNYSSIQQGTSEFAGGTSDLYGGVSELYGGTNELSNATQDMPEKIELEMNALIGEYDKSDYIPRSFTSAKNANTTSVQFVFKTDGIEKPKLQEEENTQVKETNLWDRFIRLFQ